MTIEKEVHDRATALQSSVRSSDYAQLGLLRFDDDQRLKQCVVHTREDVVLLVSYAHQSACTLRLMSKWLAVLTYIAGAAFFFQFILPRFH